MDWRQWDPPPVGVRRLAGDGDSAAVPPYQGISYCDAVRRAGEGEVLRILPGSIRVCHWSPVVLGLKEPEGDFEAGLEPRLEPSAAGLLLARLDLFPGEPEVVIVRAGRERIATMMSALEAQDLWQEHDDELDLSALPTLTGERRGLRQGLVAGVNSVLAGLARFSWWRALTHRLFRNRTITRAFEAVISRVLVDMSVCRNSTVVPMLTGKVNASFFCTGGITWGLNQAEQMTSGWPWELFQEATSEHGKAPECS